MTKRPVAWHDPLIASRRKRRDGWTPAGLRAFLDALAATASVCAASRTAGISRQSAYRLRSSPEGAAFAQAWDAALKPAAAPADAATSRAMHGYLVPLYRQGRLWGERHRYDNRLSMAVVTRLDRRLERLADEERAVVHRAIEELGTATGPLGGPGQDRGSEDVVAGRTHAPAADHRPPPGRGGG